ncbi:MAG TPA: DinB family protein [Methylomirabilota bacterium]|nr:DinB family protein [Methylomirabilota bacterium]
MSTAMVRDLYVYHRWANRALFDVAAALGEEACGREAGTHFSVPTLARMFAHVYGADAVWLNRWKSAPPSVPPYPALASMAEVRARWDPVEAEQRAFVDGLKDADLERVVEYKNTQGRAFRAPLGVLLQHVANHATHHRSEIATMLTLVSGSPPDTGISTWELIRTGQQR